MTVYRRAYLEFPKITLTTTSFVTLIAAIAGMKVILIEGLFTNTGATSVRVEICDGTTTPGHIISCPRAGSFAWVPEGGFRSTAGNAIQVRLSASGTVAASGFYAVER